MTITLSFKYSLVKLFPADHGEFITDGPQVLTEQNTVLILAIPVKSVTLALERESCSHAAAVVLTGHQ